uniref:glutaminase n=1 Tax=Albugo laibachii Nc14 TaxID=890382 RepID=F0WD28_9STRA|nr:glutamine amidotransferase subunit pdxT putative [Albugo laibachii Nc14]|eukprot:CCA19100.1 glutamine amidotransferase subunit pdxT putative [Albugo laibachii Nc14]
MTPKLRIGVLALQGSFKEHIEILQQLENTQNKYELDIVEVRLPSEIESLDALILPGGESTTIGKLAAECNLLDALRNWTLVERKPIWGTCAGMIMLCEDAKHTETGGQNLIGGLKAQISRNFFGAQVRSFEKLIDGPPEFNTQPYKAIFIRAPAIVSIDEKSADEIQILSRLSAIPEDESDPSDVIISARKENILVTAFHPELTQDDRWHRYFIEKIVMAHHHSA